MKLQIMLWGRSAFQFPRRLRLRYLFWGGIFFFVGRYSFSTEFETPVCFSGGCFLLGGFVWRFCLEGNARRKNSCTVPFLLQHCNTLQHMLGGLVWRAMLGGRILAQYPFSYSTATHCNTCWEVLFGGQR